MTSLLLPNTALPEIILVLIMNVLIVLRDRLDRGGEDARF